MGVSGKQSTPNFTYVCVSGGKKCSFFGKFDVLRFFEIPVLKFALLPYYRRIIINSNIFRHIHVLLRHIPIKPYCGIFSTRVTLAYSVPCHIQNPGIFRTQDIFRTRSRHILAGIGRTLCNARILTTLPYSELLFI